MRVRALRGVCIGVERHLKVGDVADLDAGTVQFLTSIRAVEPVPDDPPKEEPPKEVKKDAPKHEPQSVKSKEK